MSMLSIGGKGEQEARFQDFRSGDEARPVQIGFLRMGYFVGGGGYRPCLGWAHSARRGRRLRMVGQRPTQTLSVRSGAAERPGMRVSYQH